jgi:hypothetical protein
MHLLRRNHVFCVYVQFMSISSKLRYVSYFIIVNTLDSWINHLFLVIVNYNCVFLHYRNMYIIPQPPATFMSMDGNFYLIYMYK